MSNKPNILFYSQKCEMCNSLLILLKSISMLQYFRCVCIDNPKIMEKLPKEITRVPALIIPSINQILFCRDIFTWVNNIKNTRIQNFDMKTSQINPTITNKEQISTQQSNKYSPIGFVTQEMSGISDTYAYTATDAIPQHTYVQCSEMNENCIYTAPEKQTKINASIQPNYLKNVSKKRIEQDEEIKNLYIKQKEKNALEYINSKRQQNDQIIHKLVEKQQNNIIGELSN